MKVFWNIFLVLTLAAGAGVGGYLIGQRHAGAGSASGSGDSDDADADVDVAATPIVRVAPIQRGRVERKMIAYGVVAAPAGDVAVLSVGFESRVKKVLVAAGQRLDAKTPVIEVEPSPDAQLELLQAKSAVEAATKDEAQTRARFSDHLATNQDLLQSEQALQMATLKLESLGKQISGAAEQLQASGLVSKVDVQVGQVVPAGAAMVETIPGGKTQVRLGIEPSDVAAIHPGDGVSLQLVGSDAAPVQGKVQMIAQRINPETRLTDVLVSLPADSALPLDANVRGELTLAAADGLVVPRSAVLPADEGYSVFTVDGGKATEHKVALGLQNDQSAQISGDGLAAGQPVVVVGNLELEDGMSVDVQKGAAEPATQEDGK